MNLKFSNHDADTIIKANRNFIRDSKIYTIDRGQFKRIQSFLITFKYKLSRLLYT